MNKIYRLKQGLLLIALLCFSMLPNQAVQANTTKDLAKIGATANIQDDWILIDTDMSDDEIQNLLNIDEETISSIRSQWKMVGNAKIEYDIVMPQQGYDILINEVEATGLPVDEGNDLADGLKDELMQSVRTELKRQGALICHVERADRAGQFAWKIETTLNGTDLYEYQLLHEGKFVTFSINEINGTLSQEKKNFLDNFMNSLTIKNSANSNSYANTTPNGGSTHESSPLWTRVLTRAAIGAIIGAICGLVMFIIRLVQKKK